MRKVLPTQLLNCLAMAKRVVVKINGTVLEAACWYLRCLLILSFSILHSGLTEAVRFLGTTSLFSTHVIAQLLSCSGTHLGVHISSLELSASSSCMAHPPIHYSYNFCHQWVSKRVFTLSMGGSSYESAQFLSRVWAWVLLVSVLFIAFLHLNVSHCVLPISVTTFPLEAIYHGHHVYLQLTVVIPESLAPPIATRALKCITLG